MKSFRKRIVIFAGLSFFLNHVTAQFSCGFDEVNATLLKENTHYRELTENFKKRALQNSLGSLGDDDIAIYTIPIIVHVIHKGESIGTGTNISDAQVISAINTMTLYYRAQLGNSVDAHIEFELAKIDAECKATTGIERINGAAINGYLQNGLTNSAFAGYNNEADIKALSNWPNVSYCNIWVVSEINGNDGGAGLQGFTYLPGAPADVDGLVILYNAFGYDPDGLLGYNLKPGTKQNKIVTHEMGHELGLYHTFEGDDGNFDGIADRCPPNANCAIDGDGVCDTGPHERSRSDCPAISYGNCTANNDVVKNYMDYSSENCQDRFTAGQVAKMRAAIIEFRSSLIHSGALNPVIPGGAVPVAASCTPFTNTIGLSGYYAGITNVRINEKSFSSSTAKDDNALSGYLDKSKGCLNIISLNRGGYNSFSVTVLGEKNEQLRAWIDFNNDGIFDNNTEQIFINTNIPRAPNAYVSGKFIVPQAVVENVVLRMRIIDDYSSFAGSVPDISSACYDPVYGQAEDYPVIISTALPVKLLSFKASQNGNDVLLHWITTNEVNNKGFDIERSFNGIDFTAIGFVKAVEISAEKNDYNFIDKIINHENVYYRLRQIDIDGTEELSNVIAVKMILNNNENEFVLLKNPVDDVIEFHLNDVTANSIIVSLLDMSGRRILQQNMKSSNVTVIDIHNFNLQAGMYMLVVQANEKQYVRKVLKR